MLELRTLGGLDLRTPDGSRMEGALSHSKGMALLVYLVAEGEPVPRERVTGLLWPDRPEERARNALSVTLSRLRDAVGPEVVGGKGEHRLWASADHLRSDIGALRTARAEDAPERILTLYRGPFLEGFSVADAAPFARWADARRTEYRRAAYEAALQLGRQAREGGDLDRAERAYRQARELGPLKEQAAAGLIRTLALQGERSDALQIYETFTDRLREELELSPSDELEGLAGWVRSEAPGRTQPTEGRRREPAEPEVARRPRSLAAGLVLLLALAAGGLWAWEAFRGSAPGAREAGDAGSTDAAPTVAVLPFENISRDTGEADFARGMYGEVLTQLSKVSGLAVLSRKTGTGLAESEMTAAEIGREHDVQAILEGSVERAGDRLRIRTHLTGAPEDEHLWSNTYERTLSVHQIFDIQGEIASRIAEALAVELTPEERRRIETPPTGDLAAYDAYLEGRSHVQKFYEEDAGPAHVDSAIGHLRRAVRRDSGFASAHAFLGIAYAAVYAATREDRWRDSAFSAARRARRINSDLAEAHLALGFVHWRIGAAGEKGHFRSALKHLRRGRELQPSSPLAAGFLMIVHSWLGHDVETVRWAYRAARLAPNNPIWSAHVALGLFKAGLLEPAEAWARRAVAEGPDHPSAVRYLSLIRWEQERPEAALGTLRRLWEKHPDRPRALEYAARFHLEAGRYDSARALYRLARKVRRAEQAQASIPGPAEVELSSMAQAGLGYTLIQLGDTARGRGLLQEGLAYRRKRARSPNEWGLVKNAGISAALGDEEEAYRLLERALKEGYYGDYKLDSPFFESLRGERRFERLRSRVLKNQRAMQKKFRNLDIQLFPDSSVSASSK